MNTEYCKTPEKIENYELALKDNFKGWDIHHRMELIATGAVVTSSRQDLIDWGIYYDVEPEDLIFLTRSEHQRLHNAEISQETRKKISEKAKGRHHSEESRKKMSEAKKGKLGSMMGKKHSEESRKKMSESLKGRTSPNKGKHFSEGHKRKLSEIHKGKHWFNNGKTQVQTFECPDGFIRGRLKSNK